MDYQDKIYTRRQQPTAFEKKRRTEEGQSSVMATNPWIPQPSEPQQEQQVAVIMKELPRDEDVDANEEGDVDEDVAEEAEEILTGPFPTGPINPQLIPSFKCHVASKIWFNEEREVLKF